MFDCKTIEEIANLYIDNELNTFQKIEFEKHINNCDNCKAEYQQLLIVKNLVSETKQELPEDFSSILHQKLVKESSAKDPRESVIRENSFWQNYSNYIKISTGIAATILIAFVANWGLTSHWQLSNSPKTQFDKLSNFESLESKEKSSNTIKSHKIPSDESFISEDHFSIQGYHSESSDESLISNQTQTSIDSIRPYERSQISKEKITDDKDDLINTNQIDSNKLNETTADSGFSIANVEPESASNEKKEPTSESHKKFSIKQYGISAIVEIYELKPIESTENKFETNIFISTSHSDQVKSLILSLANLKQLQYEKEQNEDTLLKFKLKGFDYNNVIMFLSFTEETPNVDLTRAKPESIVKTFVSIEQAVKK